MTHIMGLKMKNSFFIFIRRYCVKPVIFLIQCLIYVTLNDLFIYINSLFLSLILNTQAVLPKTLTSDKRNDCRKTK